MDPTQIDHLASFHSPLHPLRAIFRQLYVSSPLPGSSSAVYPLLGEFRFWGAFWLCLNATLRYVEWDDTSDQSVMAIVEQLVNTLTVEIVG